MTTETGTATSVPQVGKVTITPAATQVVVNSVNPALTLSTKTDTVTLDSTGMMRAFLVCTDDPDIEPHNSWTYQFRGDWPGSPTVTCPVPMVPVDPESGKMPPLNLSTAVSRASVSGVLITKGAPGDPGPGIESIDPDGTVHLTDGSTVTWELPPALADDAAVAELVVSETETAAAVESRIREVGDGTYAPADSVPVAYQEYVSENGGASTVDELTDATTVGKAVAKASTEEVAREAISAAPLADLRAFNIHTPENYGAAVGGDWKAAIDAAITDMPTLPNTYNGSVGKLLFTAGFYNTSGGHIFPVDKRIKVIGDGIQNTMTNLKAGSTADLFTFLGPDSGVEGMTLGGTGAGGGDGLVLNNYRGFARNVFISNLGGNGISVGKTAASLGHRIIDVDIKNCRGYGIYVYPDTHSTDGMWLNVSIGNCGKSGARISTGAQMLVNVHPWGNGLYDATDNHGIWLNSPNNDLSNIESESNMGYGIVIGGNNAYGNIIAAGDVWGNYLGGLYAYNARWLKISLKARSNGIGFTSSIDNRCAGVRLEFVRQSYFDVVVCDPQAAIPAATYDTPPTYAYPGKITGALTHTYGIYQLGDCDQNVITGVVMKAETRTDAVVSVSSTDRIEVVTGETTVPAIASAATVNFPTQSTFLEVTGTTAITSAGVGYPGRRVTLRFSNAAPGGITDGNNLKLAGNFTPTANDTISLICDGTNWYETCRSGDV